MPLLEFLISDTDELQLPVEYSLHRLHSTLVFPALYCLLETNFARTATVS